MLLELVLVALVLGLIGLAVYQFNQNQKTASVTSSPAVNAGAADLAASAAALVQTEAATDASLNTAADATASEVSASDDDVANLGDGIDANTF
jgi:adenosine/AMP kinase